MTSLTKSVVMVLACLSGAADLPQEKSAEKPRVKLEFRLAETEPGEGLTEALEPDTNHKIYLHKTVELTNSDIDRAEPAKDSNGNPSVEISFTKDGSKKIAKLTGENMKKTLAVLVDGKVIMAPRINAQISDRAVISGYFTKEEVANLIKGLNGK
jgi:preprotein translocase subunit SecD